MTHEDLILIESYLKGELSDSEKIAFEERLDSDSEFYEEFKLEEQFYLSLNKDKWSFVNKGTPEISNYKSQLKDADLQKLKTTLSKVNSEFNEPAKKGKKAFYYYLAAASIALLLALQLVFNQGVSNQELYNKYAALNELPSLVTRDANKDTDKQLIKAQIHFKATNYQKALAIFEPALENEKTNILIYLYTGIAQTELGQYKKAEKTFNDLITNHQSEDSIGYWYKALVYLKNNENSKAVKELEILTKNPENFNYKDAQQLLRKIKD